MTTQCERSATYRQKKHWIIKVKKIITSKFDNATKTTSLLKAIWLQYIAISGKIRSIYFSYLDCLSGYSCEYIDRDAGLYWISPGKIEYSGLREFNVNDFKGRVIGGDWDRLEKKFSDLDVYSAMNEVCCSGQSWHKTVFYQRNINRMQKGEVIWGCSSEEDLGQRLESVLKLYFAIKEEGYRTQIDILQGDCRDNRKICDEITISIGRNGDFLFSNCAHRLTIAKLLMLKIIPVIIAVRHPEWIRFVKQLGKSLNEECLVGLPPFTHPDLLALNRKRSTCACNNDLYHLIKNSSAVKIGNVLDISGKLGCLFNKFSNDGFKCFVSGADDGKMKLMSTLKGVENYNYEVIEDMVSSVKKNRFDLVIAIDIFHSYFENPHGFAVLMSFLQNLKTKELYYQNSQYSGADGNNDYAYSDNKVIELILRYTNLAKSECIGCSSGGAPLYKLHL